MIDPKHIRCYHILDRDVSYLACRYYCPHISASRVLFHPSLPALFPRPSPFTHSSGRIYNNFLLFFYYLSLNVTSAGGWKLLRISLFLGAVRSTRMVLTQETNYVTALIVNGDQFIFLLLHSLHLLHLWHVISVILPSQSCPGVLGACLASPFTIC